MNQDIRRKRPATVVDTRPVRTYETTYHRKADLVSEVHRQARRGQVRPLDSRPTWNPDRGLWEQRVLVLKPDAPAWRKPTLVAAGAALILVALGLLAWLVIATLAAMPLAMFLLLALGAMVMVVKAGKLRTVEVTTTTTVRVR